MTAASRASIVSGDGPSTVTRERSIRRPLRIQDTNADRSRHADHVPPIGLAALFQERPPLARATRNVWLAADDVKRTITVRRDDESHSDSV